MTVFVETTEGEIFISLDTLFSIKELRNEGNEDLTAVYSAEGIAHYLKDCTQGKIRGVWEE